MKESLSKIVTSTTIDIRSSRPSSLGSIGEASGVTSRRESETEDEEPEASKIASRRWSELQEESQFFEEEISSEPIYASIEGPHQEELYVAMVEGSPGPVNKSNSGEKSSTNSNKKGQV